MALETGTYISDLVSTNPVGTDTLDKADDHLRLIKSTIKATFPNITGAVNATHTELNALEGLIDSTNGRGFLRNRIINGDMRIDQRNAGASITPTANVYSLDRWQMVMSAASKYSVQQNAGAVTPPAGYKYYMGITSLAATSLAAGDFYYIQQKIEGFNVGDLGWGAAGAQSITLSFWVRSSLTGTFGGGISNDGQLRSYPFTYTISAANTWEQKTVTIPGDTTGTWLSDTNTGIRLYFGLGVGTTFSGTASTWAATTYISATGATSVVGTNAATWYITGVQLEAGSVATPFERRQYGQELALCQRYYCMGGFRLQTYAAASNAFGGVIRYPVTMRATPSMVYSGTSYTNASGVGTSTPSSNENNFVFATATATALANVETSWTASAEL